MPDMLDMSGRLLLMSGRELRPCRTFCPAGFNKHKMSDKENKNDHWYLPYINWQKCLTGAKNVWQTTEGLPDILSGTPKIIFAITVKSSSKFAIFKRLKIDPETPPIPLSLVQFYRTQEHRISFSFITSHLTGNIENHCYRLYVTFKIFLSWLCLKIINNFYL